MCKRVMEGQRQKKRIQILKRKNKNLKNRIIVLCYSNKACI